MTAEEIWRRKTDEELQAAAACLADFTEEGERVIRAEMRARRMSQPPLLTRGSALDPFDAAPVSRWVPEVDHRLKESLKVRSTLLFEQVESQGTFGCYTTAVTNLRLLFLELPQTSRFTGGTLHYLSLGGAALAVAAVSPLERYVGSLIWVVWFFAAPFGFLLGRIAGELVLVPGSWKLERRSPNEDVDELVRVAGKVRQFDSANTVAVSVAASSDSIASIILTTGDGKQQTFRVRAGQQADNLDSVKDITTAFEAVLKDSQSVQA